MQDSKSLFVELQKRKIRVRLKRIHAAAKLTPNLQGADRVNLENTPAKSHKAHGSPLSLDESQILLPWLWSCSR